MKRSQKKYRYLDQGDDPMLPPPEPPLEREMGVMASKQKATPKSPWEPPDYQKLLSENDNG